MEIERIEDSKVKWKEDGKVEMCWWVSVKDDKLGKEYQYKFKQRPLEYIVKPMEEQLWSNLTDTQEYSAYGTYQGHWQVSLMLLYIVSGTCMEKSVD